ncbi:MAG: hypothetical protein AAGI88_09450 [Pseudomonadota bacterium]
MSTFVAHTSPTGTSNLLAVLIGLSLALLTLTAASGAVDPRILNGDPVWAKPFKFSLSFLVLFLTLSWLESRLSERWREGWILSCTRIAMTISFLAEMSYISYQAALGEPSHFNYSSDFHAAMYSLVMFTGAVVLTLGIGVFAIAASMDNDAYISRPLRLAVALGFGVSCILTLIIGSYMGGQNSSFVGAPSAHSAYVPFLGWSLEAGDLRVSHFFALHAMQFIPGMALLIEKHRALSNRVPCVLFLFTISYIALTLALFFQAISGQPMFST